MASDDRAKEQAPPSTEEIRPARRHGVRFEPLDEGCALYAPGSDHVFLLNVPASCLWTGCDGERTVRDLVREMTAAAGEGNPHPGDVERDVRRAIDSLADAGLIVFNGPGDGFPMPPGEDE